MDDTSPVVYGVPDNLAIYSDSGDTFTVSATAGGGGAVAAVAAAAARPAAGAAAARRPARPAAARPTIPTSSRDAASVEGTNLTPVPTPQPVQPWQYAIPTEEALKRNPANVIPPKFRPRVPLRFDAQATLLVSGLLDGGADIAQRPVVVDVPVGKGHVVLFANNPIWRGEDASAATSWCSTRS